MKMLHQCGGSEHRLRSFDNIRRGKEPHSVDEPDQALLIAAQRDLVAGISVQEQARRTHHEISINGFSFRDLRRDALNAADLKAAKALLDALQQLRVGVARAAPCADRAGKV